MGTSSSAVQTDPVLRDDRTSTEECCSSALQSQLAQTIPHLTAKPSGTRTPGWPPSCQHSSVGCRKQLGKAEFLLQVLAASELSHETVQAEGGPEKLLVLHRTAALSRADSSKKLSPCEISSGFFPPLGALPMAAGYWEVHQYTSFSAAWHIQILQIKQGMQ